MPAELPRDLSNISGAEARRLGLYDQIAHRHETSGRCVFCHLKDDYVIENDGDVALTANLFPRSEGDLLVIPRRHVVTLRELTPEEVLAMHRLYIIGMDLLEKALDIKAIYFLLRDGTGTDKTVKHMHGQIMNYWPGLVTWKPQDEMPDPKDTAKTLKSYYEGMKNGN